MLTSRDKGKNSYDVTVNYDNNVSEGLFYFCTQYVYGVKRCAKIKDIIIAYLLRKIDVFKISDSGYCKYYSNK